MSEYIFKGMQVSNYITPQTKILGGPYNDTYKIEQVTIKGEEIHKYNNLMVVADHMNGLVMCFKGADMVAIWNCYDMEHVSLNGKRGLVKSRGHETIEEYWFDDGEFSREHTR